MRRIPATTRIFQPRQSRRRGPFTVSPIVYSATSGLYSDSGSTPATDGGDVQQWNDLHGKGKNAYANSSTLRPEYDSASPNAGGRPVVRFTAAGENALRTPQVITGGTATIYVAFYLNSITNSYEGLLGFGWDGDSSDGGGFFLRASPASNKSAFYILKPGSTTEYDNWDGSGAAHYYGTVIVVALTIEAGVEAVSYLYGAEDASCSLTAGTPNINGKLMLGNHAGGFPSLRRSDVEFLQIEIHPDIHDATTIGTNSVALWREYCDYVLFTWTNEATGAMSPLLSHNGLAWSGPPITPVTDGVGASGDYSPILDGDNFRILCSNTRTWLSNTTNVGLWTTTNLINYTFANIDCSDTPSVYHVGGPEWFRDDDDSLHFIYHNVNSAGTVSKFYIKSQTTPGNFSSWDTPVVVTWTDEPDFYIDSFLLSPANSPFQGEHAEAGKYVLVYKNDDLDLLSYATSENLHGPYTHINTLDFGVGAEGSTLENMGGGTWRIYFDVFAGNGMNYAESTDAWATWSARTQLVNPLGSIRHGTVLKFQ